MQQHFLSTARHSPVQDVRCIAALEFKSMLVTTVLPASMMLTVADLAVLLQEPNFARGAAAVPFFLPTGLVTALLVLWIVPLQWSLGRGDRDPTDLVRGGPASIVWTRAVTVWGAMLVTTVVPTALITLISNKSTPLLEARAQLLLLAGCPLASLAPALALIRTRWLAGAETAFYWGVLALVSLGVLGRGWPIPLDALLAAAGDDTFVEKRAIVTTILATLGGVLFSWVVAHTLRPRRA